MTKKLQICTPVTPLNHVEEIGRHPFIRPTVSPGRRDMYVCTACSRTFSIEKLPGLIR